MCKSLYISHSLSLWQVLSRDCEGVVLWKCSTILFLLQVKIPLKKPVIPAAPLLREKHWITFHRNPLLYTSGAFGGFFGDLFLEEIRTHVKVAEVCVTDRRNCADAIADNFCSKLPACHFTWVKHCNISKIRVCVQLGWFGAMLPKKVNPKVLTKSGAKVGDQCAKKTWGEQERKNTSLKQKYKSK